MANNTEPGVCIELLKRVHFVLNKHMMVSVN